MLKNRVNNEIKADKVRLIGDISGIFTLQEALQKATSTYQDLVEINPNTNPPICKIIQYNKYLYQLKKRAKEEKAKQTKVETKEIRLSYNIDTNDIQTKINQAIKFLKSGDRVLISMLFKGRSIIYAAQGKAKIGEFISRLTDYCVVEKAPILNDRKLTVVLRAK